MRYEDSPDLFGCGSGSSTIGNDSCEWCGTEYNDREDEYGEPLSSDNIAIGRTVFGGKSICDCCFETIENAVLGRINYILPWYARIIKDKQVVIDGQVALVETLTAILKGGVQ